MRRPGASAGAAVAVTSRWRAFSRRAFKFEVVQGVDGRIRSVDVEDKSGALETRSVEMELLRQLATRALAPMDVALPPRGAPAPAWRRAGGLMWTLPSSTGTLNSGNTMFAPGDDDAVAPLVVFEGSGALAPSHATDSVKGVMTIYAEVTGSYRFDVERGTLTESQFMMEGYTTAGSVHSNGRRPAVYRQACILQLLDDGRAPALGRDDLNRGE